MTRYDLVQRVRSLTRDFSNSIFREQDVQAFINESVDRFRQYIPEFSNMSYLTENTSVPDYLPQQYHHMLAVYCSSRCFSQDERHYQATTMMNEFESKLDELKAGIDGGSIIITDPETGKAIVAEYEPDYVNLEPYWGIKNLVSK